MTATLAKCASSNWSLMRIPDLRRTVSGFGRSTGCSPPGASDIRPVHFLHVGKTGGTAIKYAIERAGQSAAQGAARPWTVHLHRHGVTLRDVPEGEKFFFFVRDPLSRFVSGFYSRQRKGRPRYPGQWSRQEREAFDRFPTPDRLASALSSANEEERASAKAAMTDISHVRDSYWRWFENEDYFLSRLDDLFFIGFQKTLSGDFEILKSRLRLPGGLMLPSDDVQSHANPRDLDRRLTDVSVANLRRWYAADFAFLKLCERVIRENPHVRSARPPAGAGLLQWLAGLRPGRARRGS